MGRPLIALVLCTLTFLAAGPAMACDRGPCGGCWNCPERGWGPGSGYGSRGPWMGPGAGYGYGWRGYGWMGPDRSAFGDKLSQGEAEKLVEWMIRGNPNLEVGKTTTVEGGYRVQVVTRKGGSLVDTLMVEEDTARVYPVFE